MTASRPLQRATDGQSVGAQVEALTDAGAAKVFKEVASGHSPQL
jgi:hypothetical protein